MNASRAERLEIRAGAAANDATVSASTPTKDVRVERAPQGFEAVAAEE